MAEVTWMVIVACMVMSEPNEEVGGLGLARAVDHARLLLRIHRLGLRGVITKCHDLRRRLGSLPAWLRQDLKRRYERYVRGGGGGKRWMVQGVAASVVHTMGRIAHAPSRARVGGFRVMATTKHATDPANLVGGTGNINPSLKKALDRR